MKTILVPIDFSNHSEYAFQLACNLAAIKGMSVRLLHVVEDPHFSFNIALGKQYFDQITDIALTHLEKIADQAKERGIPIDYKVEKDRKGIASNIIHHEDASLIVMGKVGVNHEESFLLGSTATKVIRSASVPVITVGQFHPDKKIRKIVFASDFEEEIIAPVLDRVIRLAEILMAELHLVKIDTRKDTITGFEQEKFEMGLKKFDLKGLKVVLHSDRTEEEGIINFSTGLNADLIALCTHGRNSIINFFKGSIAENVSLITDIPVLTYNIGSEHFDKTVQSISRGGKEK